MEVLDAKNIHRIIDEECIKGYANIDESLRRHFEQNTYLGQRLVSLIAIRFEITESIHWRSLIMSPVSLISGLATFCANYIWIWNSKKILAKALPHLFRDYGRDLECLFCKPLTTQLGRSQLDDQQSTPEKNVNLFNLSIFIKSSERLTNSKSRRELTP